MTSTRKHSQTGLTLIELMIVVAILAILSGFMVPLVAHYGAKARDTAARASLVEIRNAVAGTVDKPGFASDIGRPPNSIAELLNSGPPSGVALFNRDTNLGWRGPYLINGGASYDITKPGFTTDFGLNGDPAIFDPWGNAFVIQRLQVSGGNITFTDRSGSNIFIATTSAPDGDYTRLVSAGPNSRLETSLSDPQGANRRDDLILFLNHTDPYP